MMAGIGLGNKAEISFKSYHVCGNVLCFDLGIRPAGIIGLKNIHHALKEIRYFHSEQLNSLAPPSLEISFPGPNPCKQKNQGVFFAVSHSLTHTGQVTKAFYHAWQHRNGCCECLYVHCLPVAPSICCRLLFFAPISVFDLYNWNHQYEKSLPKEILYSDVMFMVKKWRAYKAAFPSSIENAFPHLFWSIFHAFAMKQKRCLINYIYYCDFMWKHADAEQCKMQCKTYIYECCGCWSGPSHARIFMHR